LVVGVGLSVVNPRAFGPFADCQLKNRPVARRFAEGQSVLPGTG